MGIEGFTQIPNSIIFDERLDHYDLAIYIHLASFKDAYPSMRWIQKKTKISKSKICSSIKKMEDIGLLKITRSKRRANQYDLTTKVYRKETEGVPYRDLPLYRKETTINTDFINTNVLIEPNLNGLAGKGRKKYTVIAHLVGDPIADCYLKFVPESVQVEWANRYGRDMVQQNIRLIQKQLKAAKPDQFVELILKAL